MKKILTQAIIILALLITVTSTLRAQVTIGSGEAPNAGALLDLKEATNGTSKKGLGLPRVELTNLKPTTPAGLAQSIGNASGSYNLNEHIGMIVYNTKEVAFNNITCKMEGAGPIGLYVWDGGQWQLLGKKGGAGTDVRTITDDGTQVTISYNGETTSYHYSAFGDAGYWMTENLATQYLPDGTQLPKHTANSYTEPQFRIPANQSSVQGKQGLLYNWPAVMNKNICTANIDQGQIAGATPGANEVETLSGTIQGICPIGWHVPSDREWNDLEREITTKMNQYTQTPLPALSWTAEWETFANYRGATIDGHGKAMKAKDSVLNGYNSNGDSKTAHDGGFDVLIVGYAYNGSASYFGNSAGFWSASSGGTNVAWRRHLISSSTTTQVHRGAVNRYYLFSVRCKKD
ncbi:FISUMP domain-containing protein [Dysgonomonas sp. 25]|uniref:FISUMP domain-containing protein n=1 Tax=Dysgonomonas sp. 25 TaxID=2302933 RepID=UPI0013D302F2|nr:FISUMP domain-containing protein [Dysgonomonas sp. 25]NDV70084.1 hypothetical protein [Dysgonomonas sp. 25]